MWGHIRTVLLVACTLTLTCTQFSSAQETTNANTKVVIVRVDGQERQVTTEKADVRGLLHQERILIGYWDRVEPAYATPITGGMTVTVRRVEVVSYTMPTAIPFETITRFIPALPKEPVVIQEGRDGVARDLWKAWKMDGVVTERWKDGQEIVQAAKPKIVAYGNGAPLSSRSAGKALLMTSTAYTPYDAGCNGICANGMRARRGVVAVDPRVIPLGTRVYVEGYGMAIAADTGGAIKGQKIDVCVMSKKEAYQWGRRKVTVIVLD